MSPRRGPRTAVLIAGPTASGKSALAIDLARARPAVIVNADSMQVYDALPTLTAQPTRRERDEIPHRLYSHVAAETAYSVGAFVDDVARVLGMGGDGACGNDGDVARERLPIIVGGTGLYFKALTDGLAPVPAIREDVRAHWRAERARQTPEQLHAILEARDAVMAARLRPSDPQRIVRALEVVDSTGRSLAAWQDEPTEGLLEGWRLIRVLAVWPRPELYARADARFSQMVHAGDARDEVRALTARNVPSTAPIWGALGARELAAVDGEAVSLESAIATAQQATRNYIKRQETWARRNMQSWMRIDMKEYSADGAENLQKLLAIIDG